MLLSILLSCNGNNEESKLQLLDPSGSNKDVVSNRRYQKNEIAKTLREFPSPYILALRFAAESNQDIEIDFGNIDPTKMKLDTADAELMLGIYNADMAFAAVYGRKEEFVRSAEMIKLISKQIDAPVLVNEQMLQILSDSIEEHTAQEHKKFFVENSTELTSYKDQKTAIMIVSASWLECMYLGSKIITEKNADYKKLVANQKGKLFHLIQLLNSVGKEVQPELLNRLEVLSAIYEKVEVPYKLKYDVLRSEEGTDDSLGSGQESIKMSDPVLQAIEKEIEGIRKLILKQE